MIQKNNYKHSQKWCIHVDDRSGMASQLTEKEAQSWAVMRLCRFSAGWTLHKSQKYFIHICCFIIWSWYIYEIKIHINYIYWHQVWKEIIAESQPQSRKIGKSQSSFTSRSKEGDCNACNAYALIAVNVPIMRMVYSYMKYRKQEIGQKTSTVLWSDNFL